MTNEVDVRLQNGGRLTDAACDADFHQHCACPKTCRCECHQRCHLCGEPTAPAEQRIHNACATRENMIADLSPSAR